MSNDDKPRLFVPPEALPGHRITQLWAVLSVDPADGSEGVIAFRNHPLIASDEYRLESLRRVIPLAVAGLPAIVKLVRFSVREDLETFEP